MISQSKGDEMKRLKNLLIVAMMLLLTMNSVIFSQKPKGKNELDTQLINKSIAALNHNIDGVVESALFIMLTLKNAFPERNLSEIEKQIDKLIINGDSPNIRYKAYLASIYYKHYNWFNDIKFDDRENTASAFKLISERLNGHILAVN